MIYNLGDYRYRANKIYKRVWWFVFKCIDKGPYTCTNGIREVNRLCGIVITYEADAVNKLCKDLLGVRDWSHLKEVDATNNTSGRYRVNFKDPESYFNNDPLIATIAPYKDRLEIIWENGHEAIIDVSHVNVYELMVTDIKLLEMKHHEN